MWLWCCWYCFIFAWSSATYSSDFFLLARTLLQMFLITIFSERLPHSCCWGVVQGHCLAACPRLVGSLANFPRRGQTAFNSRRSICSNSPLHFSILILQAGAAMGAILSIGWSSGRLQQLPLVFGGPDTEGELWGQQTDHSSNLFSVNWIVPKYQKWAVFRGRILVLALKKDSLCNKTVPVVRGEKSVILTRNKRFTDLFWLRIVRSISKFFRISHPNLREDRLFISRHHNFSGFYIHLWPILARSPVAQSSKHVDFSPLPVP